MNEKKKLDQNHKPLILFLAIVSVVAIGVSVWAIWFREPATVLAPDYAPKEVEEHAEPFEEGSSEKLEQPEGGGAISLTYSNEVTIDLDAGQASLMFANPASSNQDMVVQLIIKDTVVIQSGLLAPGNKVTTLELLEDGTKLLTEGGYEGKFIVLYYHQDSGEKAIINTEIPVNITVQ